MFLFLVLMMSGLINAASSSDQKQTGLMKRSSAMVFDKSEYVDEQIADMQKENKVQPTPMPTNRLVRSEGLSAQGFAALVDISGRASLICSHRKNGPCDMCISKARKEYLENNK